MVIGAQSMFIGDMTGIAWNDIKDERYQFAQSLLSVATVLYGTKQSAPLSSGLFSWRVLRRDPVSGNCWNANRLGTLDVFSSISVCSQTLHQSAKNRLSILHHFEHFCYFPCPTVAGSRN